MEEEYSTWTIKDNNPIWLEVLTSWFSFGMTEAVEVEGEMEWGKCRFIYNHSWSSSKLIGCQASFGLGSSWVWSLTETLLLIFNLIYFFKDFCLLGMQLDFLGHLSVKKDNDISSAHSLNRNLNLRQDLRGSMETTESHASLSLVI